MNKPCIDTTCGSYNPSLKNNCRHGFTDFKTFDCLGYVAEKDKEMTKNVMKCCSMCKHLRNDIPCHQLGNYPEYICGLHDEEVTEFFNCDDFVQHPYDKIIDRMEGEVPKNGR